MLIPVGLEDSRVRSIPIVSIGIGVVCILLFLSTTAFYQPPPDGVTLQDIANEWLMDPLHLDMPEGCKLGRLVDRNLELTRKEQYRLLEISGTHPDRFGYGPDPVFEQEALNELCAEFLAGNEERPAMRLGMVPARGLLQKGLITHIFMHGGWMHIIFNLLFFFILFGPFLEDVWGRLIFAGFFLLGGMAGGIAHALTDPGSTIPLVGASGAISACTGAFCLRFAKRRIGFFYVFLIVFRPYWGTLRVPAWAAGIVWFGRDLFSFFMSGGMSDVAHMAHIGGFVFGLGAAAVMMSLKAEERWGRPLDDRYALGLPGLGSAPGDAEEPEGVMLTELRRRDIHPDLRGLYDKAVETFENDDPAGGTTRLGWLVRKAEPVRDAPVLAWVATHYWGALAPDRLQVETAVKLAQAAEGAQQWQPAAYIYELAGALGGPEGAAAKLRAAEIHFQQFADGHRANALAREVLADPAVTPEGRARAEQLVARLTGRSPAQAPTTASSGLPDFPSSTPAPPRQAAAAAPAPGPPPPPAPGSESAPVDTFAAMGAMFAPKKAPVATASRDEVNAPQPPPWEQQAAAPTAPAARPPPPPTEPQPDGMPSGERMSFQRPVLPATPEPVRKRPLPPLIGAGSRPGNAGAGGGGLGQLDSGPYKRPLPPMIGNAVPPAASPSGPFSRPLPPMIGSDRPPVSEGGSGLKRPLPPLLTPGGGSPHLKTEEFLPQLPNLDEPVRTTMPTLPEEPAVPSGVPMNDAVVSMPDLPAVPTAMNTTGIPLGVARRARASASSERSRPPDASSPGQDRAISPAAPTMNATTAPAPPTTAPPAAPRAPQAAPNPPQVALTAAQAAPNPPQVALNPSQAAPNPPQVALNPSQAPPTAAQAAPRPTEQIAALAGSAPVPAPGPPPDLQAAPVQPASDSTISFFMHQGPLEAPDPAWPPKVTEWWLVGADHASLSLRDDHGRGGNLPYANIKEVAAGLVDRDLAGNENIGVLDLVLEPAVGASPARIFRITSARVPKEVLARFGHQPYRAWISLVRSVLNASGALGVPDAEMIRSGDFARYPDIASFELVSHRRLG